MPPFDEISDHDDLLDRLIGKSSPTSRREPVLSADGGSTPAPVSGAGRNTRARKITQRQHRGSTTRQALPEKYKPLESIWYGEEDGELIEQLLAFYPRRELRLILDATVNRRRFWRNSSRPVIGLDLDPRHRPQICADHTAMPFREAAFDAVVYDPPHIPNQGRDRSKDFNKRFGLGARSSKENGYTFAHTYPAFMTEAFRVLAEDGLLLCKIADYVHNHRYQWAHIDLIHAGRNAGFTACDCIIKVRKGPIIDPKWKVAHHTRRRHCYWVIFRKSVYCE